MAPMSQRIESKMHLIKRNRKPGGTRLRNGGLTSQEIDCHRCTALWHYLEYRTNHPAEAENPADLAEYLEILDSSIVCTTKSKSIWIVTA